MGTERISLVEAATKECPFCAEVIQARAIKCRYCGEFLNTRRAKGLLRAPAQDAGPNEEPLDDESEDVDEDDEVLFAATPSVFGLVGVFIKAAVVLAAAWAMAVYPLERWITTGLRIALTPERLEMLGRYRLTLALGLAAMVLTLVAIRFLKLRMTRYEVTPDRIEWARGIFDRRVDNLDMFRIIDLKLYRSIFDCIVGIGTVELTTNDASDPAFVFQKLRRPRKLYDIIKKATLESDRRNNVVHIEK